MNIGFIVAILALIVLALVLYMQLRAMRKRKDEAYRERNQVVALLATIYPSGTATTNIPGWDDGWHNCVYIDLPIVGQVSWHFHDDHASLFEKLPGYKGRWDGHDTEEKYSRVAWQGIYNLREKRAREQLDKGTR